MTTNKKNQEERKADKKKREVVRMFQDLIYKKFGIRLPDYSKKAIILFFVFLFVFFIIPTIWPQNMIRNGNQQANMKNLLGDNNFQLLNTQQGDNSEAINIQTGDNSPISILGKDGQNKIIFTSDKWNDGEGHLAGLRKDPSILILPQNFASGLLRYDEPINTDVNYEIKFKPLGNKAINFVINIPEIYEIIIGDSDYRTVTLKYSPGLNQPMSVLAIENQTGRERPKLDYCVNKNSEIKINMSQEKLSNGNLWVQLDIHYWAKGVEQKFPQSLSYEFKPSPRIEDSLYLNLGLIRGNCHDAYISIKLIKPSID